MAEENNDNMDFIISSPNEGEAGGRAPVASTEEENNETGSPVEEDSPSTTYTPDNDFEGISIMTPEEIQKESSAGTSTETDEAFIEDPEKSKPKQETKISEEKQKEILRYIANQLSENGILGELPEDFDGSLESLQNQLETNIEGKAEEKVSKYIDNFSGAKKTFLEIEDAFEDERLAMTVAQDLEFFKTVTDEQLEHEEVQKALYAKSLQARGFSNDKIGEMIDDAITLGKLGVKAREVLPSLTAGAQKYVEDSRAAKLAKIQESKAREEAEFKSMLASIDEKETIVSGLPFTVKHKEKLKNSISNTVFRDESGKEYNTVGYKQMKNPKEFETLLHYYDSLGLFNLDEKTGQFKPDLSAIKRNVKSKATKELDEIIADASTNSTNYSGGGGDNRTGDEHTNGILSLLEKGGFGK